MLSYVVRLGAHLRRGKEHQCEFRWLNDFEYILDVDEVEKGLKKRALENRGLEQKAQVKVVANGRSTGDFEARRSAVSATPVGAGSGHITRPGSICGVEIIASRPGAR